MTLSTKNWKKLLLVSLGLSAGTAFCMKWMEKEFWMAGEKFTILELELFYSREKLTTLLSSLDNNVKAALGYHLYFDFAFMAGAYPGITAACMLASQKAKSIVLRNILVILAWLQTAACISDIVENTYLLKWIAEPRISGNHITYYRFVVIVKWFLALAGVILAGGVISARWYSDRKNNF